ncbi:hypothetical protein H2200_001468 [Cladophialophora chaetospira]|uniref:SCP domain-containing protein n=1 Tax=Cladophialophora chaetospira TaxID=386627 RepID=A0AA38XL24_9EURO|nr:hypothetical protein H2200_001468 [Cladophialophora chaetospira]
MQLINTLSVLTLVTGAVVAMPAHVEQRSWGGGSNRWWQRPRPGAVITFTAYDPQPTDWDASPSSAAPSTTSTEVVVTATPTAGGGFYNGPPPAAWTPTAAPPAPAAPQPESPPPQAAPSSAPSAPSGGSGPSGGQDGYLDVVSKWRSAGGLPALAQDSTLEGNAMKTSSDSTNGLQHELNPGTFAQVLAPGDASNFESVYVGGWLCEVPSLPGLNGICSTMAQGWDHSDGETGHADILTSTKYTKIGCALSSTGVWACDLA